MNTTIKAPLKKPQFIPLPIHVMAATQQRTDIHYGIKRIWKGKELKMPICGAMSTVMTDDLKLCTCKECISSVMRMVFGGKIITMTKFEGEKEDESEFN